MRNSFLARTRRLSVVLPFLPSLAGCLGADGYFRVERSYRPARELTVVDPHRGAGEELSEVVKVAVLGPAPCDGAERSEEAPADDASDRDRETGGLGIPCGLLAAELEAQAFARGYLVVDWRELSASDDPLAIARDAGADIVFRVTERQVTIVPAEQLAATATVYSRELIDPGAEPEPLEVDGVVTSACDARFSELARVPIPATVLGVEAVDPHDGRVLWTLDRAIPQSENERGEHVARHATKVQLGDFNAGLTGGLTAMAGVTVVVAAAVLSATGLMTDKDEPLRTTLFVVGGVMVVGGFVFGAVGPTGVSYPDAELACQEGAAQWVEARTPRLVRGWARDVASRTFAEIDAAMQTRGSQ